MSEIDRVNETIDAFFDAYGLMAKLGGKFDQLAEVFANNLHMAERHLSSKHPKERDEALVKRILAAEEQVRSFVGPGGSPGVDEWKTLAREIMECRRATYDLTDPDQPVYKLTPAEALDNDDDPYSFAIFDTFAETVGALLPTLYQLAVEGSWDQEDLATSDEAP